MTYISLGYLVHSQNTSESLLMRTQDLEVSNLALESGTRVQNLSFEMTHDTRSLGIARYNGCCDYYCT